MWAMAIGLAENGALQLADAAFELVEADPSRARSLSSTEDSSGRESGWVGGSPLSRTS